MTTKQTKQPTYLEFLKQQEQLANSAEIVQQILEAQEEQLKNPTRACVNSEAIFVKHRLLDKGYAVAADLYWSFSCNSLKILDIRVQARQNALRAIDKGCAITDTWGT